MSEPTTPPPPDLAPLTADYDVVGELGSNPSSRVLLATRKATAGQRRDDSARVLIEIVREPEGDESHALQHLASDVKTLSGLRHRRLVPTLEGRWLGDDAFAIVRERVDDPSVAERLAQGETFTNTRTAAILREVHGLMEWARGQNIVHRQVTPDRIFLEPMSDRVRIAFGAGAIPRVRTREAATDDALAVIRLAVMMLTGQLDLSHPDGGTLAELRPDLPERLHEETAELLTSPASDIDVPSYLALIGMAEPVAEGETERDRIRAEVLEEQRVEREKLASERAEFEAEKEAERRALAAEGEELRRVFAEEKATLEREFDEAQQAIAAERARMQRILADERADLAAKQEQLEREVAAQFAAVERAAALDRASIEELRARIRVAGEQEIERKRALALSEINDSEIRLDTGELATPTFMRPYIASLDKITFRNNNPLEAESVRHAPRAPEAVRLGEVVEELKAPRRKPAQRRKWLVPTGIAAAVVVAAASALVIGNRTTNAAAVRRPPVATTTTTAGAMAPSAPNAARPDSLSAAIRPYVGPIAPSVPQTVPPSTPQSAAARQWLDSVRRANPMDMQWEFVQAESERRIARAREERLRAAAIARDSVVRAGGDSVRRREPAPPRDTVPRLNSLGIPDDI